jgi:hypothetical protein
LHDIPTARYYDVDSDASGNFVLDVDPGAYEIVVQPPVGVPLPRFRVLRSINQNDTVLDVQLYAPVFVYGRVLTPGGTALAGVAINLYSTDLSPDGKALLVGLGITGNKGEFVIPIPTPNGN